MNSKRKPILSFILSLLICTAFMFSMMGANLAVERNSGEAGETTEKEDTVTENTGDTEQPDTQVTTEEPAPPVANGKSTVMVYMVGSDLESYYGMATMDIEEMMDAECGEDVNIVIQAGGTSDWSTYEFNDGEVQRCHIEDSEIIIDEEMGRQSMLTTEALSDFISWSAEEFPAERYFLVLWDHGGNIPNSYGVDEIFPNDTLYISQMGQAINDAGVHFDLIAMDACLMGTMEMAMGVAPYADYLVASEYSEPGYGHYYTDWLMELDQNPAVSTEEIGTIMVESYCDFYESTDEPVCLSLIDLSQTDEIYAALKTYLSSASYELKNNNNFKEYALARSTCGSFYYIDTIDILSLAERYPLEGSEELISAIENAVVYEEGTFAYAHGLAMYSPNDYAEYYEYARAELMALGFEQEILEFYDAYLSVLVSYGNYLGVNTDVYNACADTEWFKSQSAVVDSYDDTFGDYSSMITYADLEFTTVDGVQVVELSDEDYESIYAVGQNVTFASNDGTGYISLGYDYTADFDSYGNVVAEFPESWISIDGQPVYFMPLQYYSDEYEWYTDGVILCALNGDYSNLIYMYVYWDNYHEDGCIAGYMIANPEDLTLEDETLHRFYEGDSIEFVYPVYSTDDVDTVPESMVTLGNAHTYSRDMQIEYGSVLDFKNIVGADYTAMAKIAVLDIYGSLYTSDWINE